MDKLKEVTIVQFTENNSVVDHEGQVWKNSDFIQFQTLQIGDTRYMGFNDRTNCYSEFSSIFSNKYIENNFQEHKTFQVYVTRKINENLFLCCTDNYKYLKIDKKSLSTKEPLGLYINIARKKNIISEFYGNLLHQIDIYKDGFPLIKHKVISIKKSISGGNSGLIFVTETQLEIYKPFYDLILLDINYKHYLGLIENNLLNINLFFDNDRKTVIFDPLRYMQDDLKEEEMLKLLYKESSRTFYFVSNLGIFPINISELNIIELNLYRYFNGNYFNFYIKKGQIYIGELQPEILSLKNKTLHNVKIIDRITNDLNSTIYIGETESGIKCLIDKRDLTYDENEVLMNREFENLDIEDIYNNRFIFLTRLPYLKDPSKNYLKEVYESSNVVRGKIVSTNSDFIEILLNNSYRYFIKKCNLSPCSQFNIEDKYTVGVSELFYIEEKKCEIELLGYNRLELFNSTLPNLKSKKIISGKFYKKLVTKYIIRITDEIEAELDFDEISYTSNDPFNFDYDTYYDFKVLNFKLTDDSYIIKVSRKRLSSPIFDFSKKYPVGSIIMGRFFHRSNDGYYFTVEQDHSHISTITAFLPNNEIDIYPDFDSFSDNLISSNPINFKIVSYPQRQGLHKYNIVQSSIVVSIRKTLKHDIFDLFQLASIPKEIDFNNTSLLPYGKVDNELYFKSCIEDQNIYFSISFDRLIPGITKISNFETFYIKFSSEIKKLGTEYDLLINNIGYVKERINAINNTIAINNLDHVFNILPHKIFDMEIMELSHNECWGYYLNNPVLGMKVYLSYIKGVKAGDIFNVVLSSINTIENKIMANINKLSSEHIGSKIWCEIISHYSENNYLVRFLDTFIGFLQSDSEMQNGEDILAELKSFSGKKDSLLLYNSNTQDFQGLSIFDLQNYIRESNDIDIIKRAYRALKVKSSEQDISISFIDEITELMEYGFYRESYIFNPIEIGAGNFGKVFSGFCLKTQKRVICKRFISNREDDPEYERFILEAETLKKLDIEGIPKVHSFIPESKEYISEFVEGETLKEFISSKQPSRVYLDILIKITNILEELNQDFNIVHCDIKPENIIINPKTINVTIIDFGSIDCENSPGGFGTLYYSSPKQCKIYSNPSLHFSKDHKFSVKDDIYSFGVLMYELFTGRKPYGSELEEETIIYAHQYGQLESNREYSFTPPNEVYPDIINGVTPIILKCMATYEDSRYDDFFDISCSLEDLF